MAVKCSSSSSSRTVSEHTDWLAGWLAAVTALPAEWVSEWVKSQEWQRLRWRRSGDDDDDDDNRQAKAMRGGCSSSSRSRWERRQWKMKSASRPASGQNGHQVYCRQRSCCNERSTPLSAGHHHQWPAAAAAAEGKEKVALTWALAFQPPPQRPLLQLTGLSLSFSFSLSPIFSACLWPSCAAVAPSQPVCLSLCLSVCLPVSAHFCHYSVSSVQFVWLHSSEQAKTAKTSEISWRSLPVGTQVAAAAATTAEVSALKLTAEK